mmetsp:Transcript_3647/g.9140  ORF Transcript_3647/g.9140 Transcript_3647/m.9140 type:complete len:292 (+) Transcript_3647:332-1207(+)
MLSDTAHCHPYWACLLPAHTPRTASRTCAGCTPALHRLARSRVCFMAYWSIWPQAPSQAATMPLRHSQSSTTALPDPAVLPSKLLPTSCSTYFAPGLSELGAEAAVESKPGAGANTAACSHPSCAISEGPAGRDSSSAEAREAAVASMVERLETSRSSAACASALSVSPFAFLTLCLRGSRSASLCLTAACLARGRSRLLPPAPPPLLPLPPLAAPAAATADDPGAATAAALASEEDCRSGRRPSRCAIHLMMRIRLHTLVAGSRVAAGEEAEGVAGLMGSGAQPLFSMPM